MYLATQLFYSWSFTPKKLKTYVQKKIYTHICGNFINNNEKLEKNSNFHQQENG